MRAALLVACAACGAGGPIRVAVPDAEIEQIIVALDADGYLNGLRNYGMNVRLVIDNEDPDIRIIRKPDTKNCYHDPFELIVLGSDCLVSRDGITYGLSHELIETLFDPNAAGVEIADACDSVDFPFHIDGMLLAGYVQQNGSCWTGPP